MNVMLKFVLLAMGFTIAYALSTPVYDCDFENRRETNFSLINAEKCNIPRYNEITTVYRIVRFLEVKENFSRTDVIKCKVKVRRTLFHCRNSSSGIDAVKNNTVEYIHEVSYDTCKYMHEKEVLIFPMGTKQASIERLKVNVEKQKRFFYAGEIDDVECKGANYSDLYGTWQNVAVVGNMEISLEAYSANISFDKNEIYLRSNIVCSLSNENCLDVYDGSQAFWKSIPFIHENISSSEHYYVGRAIYHKYNNISTIYIVFYEGIALTFNAKHYESFPFYSVYRTQHSRLLLIDWKFKPEIEMKYDFDKLKKYGLDKQKKFSIKQNYDSYVLNLAEYINSKTFYVENRDIQLNWISLCMNAVEFYCNLDYQKLIITSAYRNDLFAYNLMEVPGYTAIFLGDVVRIIKCILIEVELTENTDECFLESQVQLRNKTYYMMPFTRILNLHGTRIPCKSATSSYDFVSSSPSSHLPLSEQNNYVTQKTMLDVENHLTILTKNVTILKKILEDMMWLDNPIFQSNFITVDFRGLFFVCVIVFVIQIIVDIIIRGFTLHSIFGWSINLLGAIWSSTSLFLCSRKILSKKTTTSSGSLNLEMNTNVTIE